jgi:hypothetical protein
MEARDSGDFSTAIRLLTKADDELRIELKKLAEERSDKTSPGPFEQKVAAQLAHILGSKGGVYLREKKYKASIDSYDAGYTFERPDGPYGIVNSYNLTQRLVARAFLNPRAVEEAAIVEELPLRAELGVARREIERQRRGKRRRDEYAAADLAVVALLKGDADWRERLDGFLNSKPRPQPYAIEVTLDVLASFKDRLAEMDERLPELEMRVARACEEMRNKMGA